MNSNEIEYIFRTLSELGISIGPGLTSSELERIENQTETKMPENLHDLLSAGVPTGKFDGVEFPDWHHRAEEMIKETKATIKEAFKFDIENNNFWHKDFGEKSTNLEIATESAMSFVESMPILFPVYGHRFLPSIPDSPGNPVLSFVQPSDVIVYGVNLLEYFKTEFTTEKFKSPQAVNVVPFWSDLL